MKQRHFRLTLLVISLTLGGIAVMLILRGMEGALVYFYMPSDLPPARIAALSKNGERVRIGGLVASGSHGFDTQHSAHTFVIDDSTARLSVRYGGILPTLFREGQGVIAEGRLTPEGLLIADRVLAKHDEKYMPPEVKQGLAAIDRQKLQQGVTP